MHQHSDGVLHVHVRAGGRQDVPNRLTELVQHLVRKNRGANRNVPPPGLSDNSVLVSAFFMLLRTLRPYLEGRAGHDGGLSTFPAGLMFLQVCELTVRNLPPPTHCTYCLATCCCHI